MRKLIAVLALVLLAAPGFAGGGRPAVRKAPQRSSVRCIGCARDKSGRIKRSESAKMKFRRSNPCPSTGRASGPCPGYAVDHRVPLYKGGSDSPGNMQWLSKPAHKAKHSKR